jgi:NADH-quinone oxidoreductase subunit L
MNTLSIFDYKLLLAVPLIPLVGYVVQLFFGRKLPRSGDWLLTGGMFVVMCITVYMFLAKAIGHVPGTENLPFFNESFRTEGAPVFRWLYSSSDSVSPNIVAGILYDGLAATMLMVVGVVSFLVHLFSCGYMKGDRRYHIFFANISLFTFAMLGLILSDNILFMFVFWELMGLMSYLLIGHFSHDPNSHRITHAAAACKKAFLTTRVGDTCLFFGMAMFFFFLPREFNDLVRSGAIDAELVTSSFRFSDLWYMTSEIVTAGQGYPAWMTIAGLFAFGGTMGKSAQFPLHIWLPDAMEGPTPVSAMIHAATMVAAGVFLLGRIYPMMSPEVLMVVMAVGGFTALFAATIGCTVFDIKGVLAYSTISQLGFMVAAIGTGGLGLVAGLFHMVTHAFFKACLFLSAGSVIHGCHHEQDMRKMGGLRKKMPITFAAMLICTLAIAGTPLFAGFYSKDRIIASAIERTFYRTGDPNGAIQLTDYLNNGVSLFVLIALALGAMLTTFYMFRLIFMTFYGKPQDEHIYDHAHESPKAMTIALMALSCLAILGGHFWIGNLGDLTSATHGTWFTNLIDYRTMFVGPGEQVLNVTKMNTVFLDHHSHGGHMSHNWALVVSTTVLVLGVFGAWWIYYKKKIDPKRITDTLGLGYEVVRDKYYVDEAVNATVIKGTMLAAKSQTWFDENIIDGLVLGVGKVGKGLGTIAAWFDKNVVDGLVNGLAHVTQSFGSAIRLLQTGRIQQYISYAVGGAILLAAFHILS